MHYRQQKIFNNPKQLNKRTDLRNTLTPAEAALWTLLQGSKLKGRKFRRQHGIENYIVDFYCPSEKLIIELDGEAHNNPAQAEYDMARETRLRELRFKVLRFENKLVFQQTEALLHAIESAFSQ